MSDLESVLASWLRTHGVATAWATWDDGRRALAAAGFAAEMLGAGATEKRDVVLVEVAPGDDEAELTRLAGLATKALVAVTPNTRRVLGLPAARTVIPLLWRIGRVRERATLGDGGFALGLLPSAVRARLSPGEAFFVDVSPRTPQARRKLLRTVP